MDGLSFLALAISSSWYAAAAFMAASSRQRVTARPSPVDGLLIMKMPAQPSTSRCPLGGVLGELLRFLGPLLRARRRRSHAEHLCDHEPPPQCPCPATRCCTSRPAERNSESVGVQWLLAIVGLNDITYVGEEGSQRLT